MDSHVRLCHVILIAFLRFHRMLEGGLSMSILYMATAKATAPHPLAPAPCASLVYYFECLTGYKSLNVLKKKISNSNRNKRD